MNKKQTYAVHFGCSPFKTAPVSSPLGALGVALPLLLFCVVALASWDSTAILAAAPVVAVADKIQRHLDQAASLIEEQEKLEALEARSESQDTRLGELPDLIEVEMSEAERLEKLDIQKRRMAKFDDPEIRREDPQPKVEVGEDRAALEPWHEDKDQAFSLFLRAVRDAELDPQGIDKRLLRERQIVREYRAAQGLSEALAEDGGFLLSPTVADGLIQESFETGMVISAYGSPTSISGNSMTMNGVDETSRVEGSQFGGVQIYSTGEAAAYTKSKPAFRQINLRVNKLTGLFYATDEQLDDIPAFASQVRSMFVQAFGWKLDNLMIRGTGTAEPLGVLNAGSLVSVAKEGSQAADTIDPDNIYKMYARAILNDLGGYRWFINQDVLPQLFALNQGNNNLFLPGGQIVSAPFGAILGIPVVPIEQCSTIGDQGDIILANFRRGYVMVDKAGGIRQASSIHVQFTTGEQAFRFTYRIDGQPLFASAITPSNGSNTLSRFVTLDARA